MPKGDHLKKYHHSKKLNAQMNIKINSEEKRLFYDIEPNPHEAIRAFIRKRIADYKKKFNDSVDIIQKFLLRGY